MPRITSVKPQKRKERFNIFLDGKFAFGVDENILVKNHLKVGKILTGDQIDKLIKETVLGKLFDQALRFLSYRPRSEKEITTYLAQKIAKRENIKFREAKESPLIGAVALKLKRYNYLDDRQFAKWLVGLRIKSASRGLSLIKQELIQKGIDKEIIQSLLSKYPNQTLIAKKAIEKKLKRWQGLSELGLKKKVYAYLASRGFDFETIKEVFAFLLKRR
ncbi:MAG: Regulatory protein RecX [Candidatus Curtissbacteria bacterium GW2011_GWC2_38_9]|uniref:Regulatory protein RecX n=3 Tax=Candidatus Curtissiibacteriota TaxID=1752717 RepID=A0A1F5HR43_9BACT|nr:MAG: Regulatory protein RecX [Candidatus Curtissbacteria bacterium GW2011_GWC2_38_9]KKS03892.1 MAG: Regulatory protein RecX [Candidatus Curtissbacteria bacterium GW2011_GWA2_41_24]OGD89232.1 MAG: hypothetical protein A2Z54_00655 [Candidatus Curtissbacteria bacterium RIFCSPHIGHO2_02_39_8]OGE06681.1 MAG: hypothetical protein A2W70_04475 [Candidatus Curtissbacteria bacterium RIFCSPLOWO2_02_41_11]